MLVGMLEGEDRGADVMALHCLRTALYGRPPATAVAAGHLLRHLTPSGRALRALLTHLQVRTAALNLTTLPRNRSAKQSHSVSGARKYKGV